MLHNGAFASNICNVAILCVMGLWVDRGHIAVCGNNPLYTTAGSRIINNNTNKCCNSLLCGVCGVGYRIKAFVLKHC